MTFWIIVILFVIFAIFYVCSCVTIVQEGTAKNVVRFGGYKETLLQKKGFRVDADGEVVVGKSDNPLPGGLHFVSPYRFFFGIDRIYTTTMEFVKLLTDGTTQVRIDKDRDFIKVVPYPYALVFKNEEDLQGLPLFGIMAMTAMITNPRKALFGVNSWFDILVSEIYPFVRDFIAAHTYKDIHSGKVKMAKEIWDAVSAPGSNNEPSILDRLKGHGITLISLKLVAIDPPDALRASTLKEFEATQRRDAAILEAEAEEKRLFGSIKGATGEAIHPQDAVEIKKRDMAGGGDVEETVFRVGNLDGSSFGQGTFAEAIGGLAAAFFAKKDSGNGGGGSGNKKRRRKGNQGNGGQGGKKDEDIDPNEWLDRLDDGEKKD
jgi:regulator of protease activity HflC (stomatin/prohibitin superfamily)